MEEYLGEKRLSFELTIDLFEENVHIKFAKLYIKLPRTEKKFFSIILNFFCDSFFEKSNKSLISKI